MDQWVRAWSVTPAADLPRVPAAAVTLRLDGSPIGRGTAISTAPGGDAQVIAAAARRALDEATTRMPVPRDALFDESVRALAPTITISLELAGGLTPLMPVPHEYSDVSLALAPGLEGVAIRFGERIDAMFPGTMLATGTEPGSAAAAVVSRVVGDPAMGLKRPIELAEEHGAVFYRFRIVHLAQARPGMPPVFLHRGGRIIDRSELTIAGLRQWADGMAAFIIRGIVFMPDAPSSASELNPVTGAVRTDTVSGVHIATCALALVRYSQAPGVSDENAARARNGARQLLESLLDLELSPDLLGRRGAAAVATAAIAAPVLHDLGVKAPEGPGRGAEAAADPLTRLAAIVDTALRDIPDDLPPAARQLVAWGLSQRSDSRDAARHELRRLFRETSPGHTVSLMPWAGWAELALADHGDVPAAIALREMREQVWAHQLRADALPTDWRDLGGGIVFTASRSPLPNWHAARPLAFIATMLGDERLTSAEEVPAELSNLMQSMRFLRQLSAGEVEGHMYRSPHAAMWGIRASVWDQRMPPEATALTLLCVSELMRSMETIRGR